MFNSMCYQLFLCNCKIYQQFLNESIYLIIFVQVGRHHPGNPGITAARFAHASTTHDFFKKGKNLVVYAVWRFFFLCFKQVVMLYRKTEAKVRKAYYHLSIFVVSLYGPNSKMQYGSMSFQIQPPFSSSSVCFILTYTNHIYFQIRLRPYMMQLIHP